MLESQMDNIQILVVEDNISLVLEMMIADLGYEYMGNYTNSEDAIDAITTQKPDLIIMDINIQGKKDGIDIAKEIISYKIPIIFITAFEDKDYFERAKLITPAAYLVKTFHLLTLQNTIELAVMKMQKSNVEEDEQWTDNISSNGAIFIKMNKVLRKVYVNDIYWIEVSGNYSYLFTKEKKYILKMSLKTILKNINLHAEFLRVHKQFVVQLKRINSVSPTENTLEILNTTIPIGRKYNKELLEKIQFL